MKISLYRAERFRRAGVASIRGTLDLSQLSNSKKVRIKNSIKRGMYNGAWTFNQLVFTSLLEHVKAPALWVRKSYYGWEVQHNLLPPEVKTELEQRIKADDTACQLEGVGKKAKWDKSRIKSDAMKNLGTIQGVAQVLVNSAVYQDKAKKAIELIEAGAKIEFEIT